MVEVGDRQPAIKFGLQTGHYSQQHHGVEASGNRDQNVFLAARAPRMRKFANTRYQCWFRGSHYPAK